MNRRDFLRMAVVTTAAGKFAGFSAELSGLHPEQKPNVRAGNWGSGHFGEWVQDSHDLPAYRYTCDQVHDPKARTPVESAWRSATDHTHQVGNDRILAAVSNFGYVQVRQDEGAPKFLNDYHPEDGLFGAGLGYLTDGETIISTFYPGNAVQFDRYFGMGYYQKAVTGEAFKADHLIFAPFGDDPVLISQVTVSNLSHARVALSWAEYWGCQMYQFSYRSYMEGYDLAAGRVGGGSQVDPERVTRLRREFARRFRHSFSSIQGQRGLLERKEFQGRSPQEEELWEGLKRRQMANSDTFLGPPVNEASGRAQMDDVHPCPTFLCSLDGLPVTWTTDAARFFGAGGVLHPDGMLAHDQTVDQSSATGPESALIFKKHLTLEAGEQQTLSCIYGYLPEGFSLDSLLQKYGTLPLSHFATSCKQWKESGIALKVESEPWISREVAWHSYYLRSGFTFDDFFGEHIVSQGQVYQYVMGFQGAPRDPLQHALPMIFAEPSLTKEVLRYTLKSQKEDGTLPYAMVGHGVPMPSFWLPSDLDLWLLWTASEYLLATRDLLFLQERTASSSAANGATAGTIGALLKRSYRHLKDVIGTGQHGLIKGHNDDWNDEIYWRGIPEELHVEVRRESESTMNAAMASYILDRYAEMLRFTGDSRLAREVAEFAEEQRIAVRAQWTGRWFKRLWLGPSLGWLGEDRMWLETQPWAVVGGAATGKQQVALVAAIDELLRRPSPIGAKQVSKPVQWPGVVPGETENGGVWAALDGPLIWALASVNGEMAWDEWIKNSRARHAEVYPDVWYGIWSGTDVFASVDSPHAGQTGYDYALADGSAKDKPSTYRGLSWTAWPVMCMHRHAWPLYSAAKLAGIEFTRSGIDFSPTIPHPAWSFESKLVGIRKNAQGFDGWYHPQFPGHWVMRFQVPPGSGQLYDVFVNGIRTRDAKKADGSLEFSGHSTASERLDWKLVRIL